MSIMTNVPVMVDTKVATQPIPVGPVASFESCKQLFTNGGGWYGVNSAHPFENPTPLTNFLEMLAIIVVPMAQVYMFGLLIGNKKHAWCLFMVMLGLYLFSFGVAWYCETRAQPRRRRRTPRIMEGKEQRFGVMNSVLWGVSCTAIDNGSVNSMHDSWMPLAGLMPMWNILIGEIMFGGIGCGMYCMLFHVLIAVFIAGLMIGRTPEYLGKKLAPGKRPGRLSACSCPMPPVCSRRRCRAWSRVGTSTLGNAGPHGLSEVLYAYAEAANNNGSAFAGLNANIPCYDVAAWPGHHHWPVRAHCCGAGNCRSPGQTEDGGSVVRHAADPRLDLRADADRGDRGRGGADVFPGAVPWPHRGALADAGGPHFLKGSTGNGCRGGGVINRFLTQCAVILIKPFVATVLD